MRWLDESGQWNQESISSVGDSYLLRMQEMLQQERKGNMIIGAIFTKLSQVINKILIKWK